MKEFLENEMACHIIGEASNGEEFLNLTNIHEADIVLMDIQMPLLSGMDAAKIWTLQYPNSKMIAVTMYNEKIYLNQLIEVGFKGCVLKTRFFEDVILAFDKILRGGMFFNESLSVKN